jgi:hypothetical protein
MSNILEGKAISDWAAVITLFLTVCQVSQKSHKAKGEILKELREFKWRLMYTIQQDSEANVVWIQNEMLDYLYKVKATMIFSSFFNPFKYQEEIFSSACQKYAKRREGVTLEDVVTSTIDLVDSLIQTLNTN